MPVHLSNDCVLMISFHIPLWSHLMRLTATAVCRRASIQSYRLNRRKIQNINVFFWLSFCVQFRAFLTIIGVKNSALLLIEQWLDLDKRSRTWKNANYDANMEQKQNWKIILIRISDWTQLLAIFQLSRTIERICLLRNASFSVTELHKLCAG